LTRCRALIFRRAPPIVLIRLALSTLENFGGFMKKYLAAIAALCCVPGVAAAQDAPLSGNFDGPRLEARIGWETPTVSEDGDVFKIESDVSFGGEVGFDLRAGDSVVVGPFATYEFSNVNICDGGDCLSENGNLAAGLRVGVALSPTTLVYGKLGYSRISFDATSGGVTESDHDEGIGGAIGVNLNFGRNVYGLIEANYADYGKFFGINLQRRQVAAGVGLRF
jgi:outer membrane immunogenic protein